MTLPYLPTTGCPAPDLRRPLAELPVAGAESGRYAPSPSREPRDRVRTRRPGRVTPGGGGRVPPGSCLPARPVALRTLCAGAGRARPRPDGPQNVDQASASRLRKVRPGSIRQATRDITWRNGVPAPVLRGPDDGPPADEPGADDLGPGDHAAAHVAGRSPHRTFSVGRSSVREGLPYVTVRGSPTETPRARPRGCQCPKSSAQVMASFRELCAGVWVVFASLLVRMTRHVVP